MRKSSEQKEKLPNTDSYRARFGVTPMIATAQNLRAVTAKQLIDATQSKRYGGRYVLNNSQLYTVKLCGMVVAIDQNQTHTDFALYDGTGTVNGRTWPQNNKGETSLTGAVINSYYEIISNVISDNDTILLQTVKITKINDHNIITLHMLTAIHEDCELGRLKNTDLERWQHAEQVASMTIRTNLSRELDKEAVHSMLSKESIRTSERGASSRDIMESLHMDEQSTRETLQEMIEEGSVYNTVDYNHYKLADEN